MSSDEMIKETEKRIQQAESAVQLGIGVGETLLESMKRFFSVLRDICTDSGERSLKEAYKTLKGKRFTDEGKFILNAKMQGNRNFVHTAVSDSELKEFEKLCRNYGIDYLFQKRPVNLEDLFQRKLNGETLSKNQDKILDAFTIKAEDGSLSLKEDTALITFSEDDIDIMEKVVDKLEEKTYNIEQRKLRAEKIVRKAKENIKKAKEKGKEKEKVPSADSKSK